MDTDDSAAASGSSGSAKKRTISPWIPVSLLAVTTLALAVPLVVLRRQRAAAISDLGHQLNPAPSPPRRTARPRHAAAGHNVAPIHGGPPPRRIARPHAAQPRPRAATPTPAPESETDSQQYAAQDDGFSGAFYTLKAFSIATALVMTGGIATVMGIKAYLGVKDTQEFAFAMRQTILSKMPVLMARLHRPATSEPLPPLSLAHPQTEEASSSSQSRPLVESWKWSDAQRRLSEAFEQGGLGRWAEVAARELEAEAEVERRARGV